MPTTPFSSSQNIDFPTLTVCRSHDQTKSFSLRFHFLRTLLNQMRYECPNPIECSEEAEKNRVSTKNQILTTE